MPGGESSLRPSRYRQSSARAPAPPFFLQLEEPGLHSSEEEKRDEPATEDAGLPWQRRQTTVRPLVDFVFRNDRPARRIVQPERLSDFSRDLGADRGAGNFCTRAGNFCAAGAAGVQEAQTDRTQRLKYACVTAFPLFAIRGADTRPILSWLRAIGVAAQRAKRRRHEREHGRTKLPGPASGGRAGKRGPTEARKRTLKELADRLDQHHLFAKGQFVVWKAGLKSRKFPAGLRRALDRDRGFAEPGLRFERDVGGKSLFSRSRRLSSSAFITRTICSSSASTAAGSSRSTVERDPSPA